jgi:hypothetical protein
MSIKLNRNLIKKTLSTSTPKFSTTVHPIYGLKIWSLFICAEVQAFVNQTDQVIPGLNFK